MNNSFLKIFIAKIGGKDATSLFSMISGKILKWTILNHVASVHCDRIPANVGGSPTFLLDSENFTNSSTVPKKTHVH